MSRGGATTGPVTAACLHCGAGVRRSVRLGWAVVICALAAIGLGAGIARANTPLTWTVTAADAAGAVDGPGLNGVSCASAALCVGVDDLGNVVASGRPTGGAAAWTVTTVDTNGEGLNGVSCVSVLCVAVDEAGDVVTSTDPTDGPWTVANVDGLSGLSDVSCASKSFCAAGDEIGDVVTSTDPTGGADAWTAPTSVDPGTNGGINGVSCVSSSFCVAVDGAGNVVSSTDPTGGPAAWTVTNVDGTSGLNGVSCPSRSLCVAVDDAGDVVSSTNPAVVNPVWSSPTNVDPATNGGLSAVSCATASFCVAVDEAGDVVTSADPTGGAAAWTVANVDDANNGGLSSVSCPSTSLCVAGDLFGNVVVGTSSTPSPGRGGGGGGAGAGGAGGSGGGGGGAKKVDELRGLKLATHTVRFGRPVTFEVSLRAAAAITVEILRFRPATGHGRHRTRAHYVVVGMRRFSGKAGVNKLLIVKLHRHKLLPASYQAEVSAGGRALRMGFTVRGR